MEDELRTIVESNRTAAEQSAIRRLPWHEVLWAAAVFLALGVFLGLYYKSTFVGLVDRHAMDAAQIARNVSSGQGFTTHLIRPFNVVLVGNSDLQSVELNTGPAFPYVVASGFKLKGWSDQGTAWVSLFFMLATVVSTYVLGRLLFNARVGLLSAAVMGVSAPVLEAATSGTEWTMAAFLFSLMLLAVALHHGSTLGQGRMPGHLYAAACAVLLALLYMTNHILLFLVVPLAVYFAVTGERRRFCLIVFAVTAVVAVAPWAYRNASLTGGSILGANAWDIMANTTAFPGDVIYRSTEAANLSILRVVLFPIERFESFAAKLMTGTFGVMRAMSLVLGVIVLPFALVSTLYKFKIPSANAVRGFVYGAAVLLVICFALFSVDSYAVILLAPIAAIFGSAYFLLLLDAKKLHPVYARTVITALVLATCWPALGTVVWKSDLAERNKALASTMILRDTFNSIMYTDVPWVIAWRTSGLGVWLPCKDDDVYELNSRNLPMRNVVLTPECESYSPTETWYMLYKYQFWRDYLKDPSVPAAKAAISMIAAQRDVTVELVERGLREMKRQLPISESIIGCTAERFGSLSPDDLIIVNCPPR
jgi:4-amino-4-deoxy-L-arabinose transferase-like glycosyltransferase